MNSTSKRNRFQPGTDVTLPKRALCDGDFMGTIAVGLPPEMGSSPVGGVLGDSGTEPVGSTTVDPTLTGGGSYDGGMSTPEGPAIDYGALAATLTDGEPTQITAADPYA